MAAEILLGTQGWECGAWMGSFYPHGTRTREMLDVYTRAFPTVEVDATAYGPPAEPLVLEWKRRVPEGFTFTLRVPQQITHERRLVDTERLVRRFVERAALLGEHLGPLLIQLSPGFRPTDRNREVLARFLDSLPGAFRWTLEFRHAGWFTDATVETLRDRRIALALVDGRWIRRELMVEMALEPTAGFAYLRWEGAGGRGGRGRRLTDFSHPQLDREREFRLWADAVRGLAHRVGAVYGYFDDRFQGHAPHSVRELQRLLGQSPVAPEALRAQAELF